MAPKEPRSKSTVRVRSTGFILSGHSFIPRTGGIIWKHFVVSATHCSATMIKI